MADLHSSSRASREKKIVQTCSCDISIDGLAYPVVQFLFSDMLLCFTEMWVQKCHWREFLNPTRCCTCARTPWGASVLHKKTHRNVHEKFNQKYVWIENEMIYIKEKFWGSTNVCARTIKKKTKSGWNQIDALFIWTCDPHLFICRFVFFVYSCTYFLFNLKICINIVCCSLYSLQRST